MFNVQSLNAIIIKWMEKFNESLLYVKMAKAKRKECINKNGWSVMGSNNQNKALLIS